MKFYSQQLDNGRWGIYKELQLMASVGNIEARDEMLDCLTSSKKKKPKRINILEKTAKLIREGAKEGDEQNTLVLNPIEKKDRSRVLHFNRR